MSLHKYRGVTLIELVVAITIIAIAVSAVLGVLAMASAESAKSMVRIQAVSIANAYLENVLQKPYAAMAAFSESGAHDQFGTAINGLEQYQVSVSVAPVNFPTAPVVPGTLVSVTVTDPMGQVVVMSGIRTSHGPL